MFHHCVTRSHTNPRTVVECSYGTWTFHPTSVTVGYTACSVTGDLLRVVVLALLSISCFYRYKDMRREVGVDIYQMWFSLGNVNIF